MKKIKPVCVCKCVCIRSVCVCMSESMEWRGRDSSWLQLIGLFEEGQEDLGEEQDTYSSWGPSGTDAHTHTDTHIYAEKEIETKTDGPKHEKSKRCVKLNTDLQQQWKAKAPSRCVPWLSGTGHAHWWRPVRQSLCDSSENPPTAYRSVNLEMLDGWETPTLEVKVKK